ncbi:MAG TPA: hypothetical protein VEV83_07250, partial [Parafilimonas sp.]|nr:hypothetical protein [Parafilimonas sp.]
MKRRFLRCVWAGLFNSHRLFIALGLAIIFQCHGLKSKAQTTYWVESMSNTVKKENVATPP